MKVYVDSNDYEIFYNSFNGRECLEALCSPLIIENIHDYTKQVRKEVCEEIKDLAGNYFELPYCDNCGETYNDDVVLTGNDLTEILDQIQGETK